MKKSNVTPYGLQSILIALLVFSYSLFAFANETKKTTDNKIYAESVGSDQISELNHFTKIKLTLNKEKDRVGARFSSCKPWEAGEDDPVCNEVIFLFPQLHFESEKRAIFLGDQAVANLRRGGVIRLSKDYKLGYQSIPKTIDSGFERRQASSVKVFLERTVAQ